MTEFDTNKDGSLSLAELTSQFFGDESMEHDSGKWAVEALSKDFDLDGNGLVDAQEMPGALVQRLEEMSEEELTQGEDEEGMPMEGEEGEELEEASTMLEEGEQEMYEDMGDEADAVEDAEGEEGEVMPLEGEEGEELEDMPAMLEEDMGAEGEE